MKNTKSLKAITLMALLIATGYASLFVVRFPLIPSAAFLRFDIKDVFIAVGGLLLGPWAALLGGIVVSAIQILTVSEFGLIGLVMNILSVSSFVMPVSIIYHRKKTTTSLVLGLVAGCVCMTVAMVGWNYLISPLYMGISREAIASMLIPVFLPFNAIKSTINALLVFAVWQVLKNHNATDRFVR